MQSWTGQLAGGAGGGRHGQQRSLAAIPVCSRNDLADPRSSLRREWDYSRLTEIEAYAVLVGGNPPPSER